MRLVRTRTLFLAFLMGTAFLVGADGEKEYEQDLALDDVKEAAEEVATVPQRGGDDPAMEERYRGSSGSGVPEIQQDSNTLSLSVPGAFKMTIKNCAATAGINGASDLIPVFETLKGCPTGMVSLLSQGQGGPAFYTWDSLAPASDIGNLLLYGPTSSSGSSSSKRAEKKEEKERKKEEMDGKALPSLPPSPLVTIELAGEGPLRTGPWAASNLAFRPSLTQSLTGTPFLVSDGDADLREVSFSGFDESVFKVTDGNVLKVVGGGFSGNGGEGGMVAGGEGGEAGGLVDVEGGTMYCHRCHFVENEGMKLITALGPESLVGLSFSRFIDNDAVGALVQATEGSRGGFASTSFINNAVTEGAVLKLTNGSVFLGQNSLFKSNMGGDLLAEDSHYRVDKSLFTGSSLSGLMMDAEGGGRGGGAAATAGGNRGG